MFLRLRLRLHMSTKKPTLVAVSSMTSEASITARGLEHLESHDSNQAEESCQPEHLPEDVVYFGAELCANQGFKTFFEDSLRGMNSRFLLPDTEHALTSSPKASSLNPNLRPSQHMKKYEKLGFHMVAIMSRLPDQASKIRNRWSRAYLSSEACFQLVWAANIPFHKFGQALSAKNWHREAQNKKRQPQTLSCCGKPWTLKSTLNPKP